MSSGRPSSLVATCDQWVRCAHASTAVDGLDGVLTLSWATPAPPVAEPDGCRARGLATDRLCRIYRLIEGRVERWALGPTRDGLAEPVPEPVVVIDGRQPDGRADPADFTVAGAGVAIDPVGVAIDADDRLFLADAEQATISVLDLWSRRLLRSVPVGTAIHPGRTPAGLGGRGGIVYAVVRSPAGLLRLSATGGPHEAELPPAFADLPAGSEPARVAVLADATPVVLAVDPTGDAWVLAGDRAALSVGPASDIVVDREGTVVVAPCEISDGRRTVLRRFVPTATGWTRSTPLDATGYDGNGLVVTRDGRIGFFAASGFRLAVATPVQYATTGSCTTYRLDSGVPRNRWGRVLLEACVPDGTSCAIATVTSDDDDLVEIAGAPADPASCVAATATSPPLAPVAVDPVPQQPAPLHRRPDPVTPWWPADEPFDTFEAPVMAPPGRYLWVTVRLDGNERRTPRVRELRVEQTAHGLLRRLPAVFAADPAQGEFLQRYLATFDGLLHDLDLRARCREILVDPRGTPAEALDWLASFLGLVLDDRWAESARRQLVAEIAALYRRRGTVWALGRYIEIFLAGDRATDPFAATPSPVIIEHFRLRGIGGPLLDGDPTTTSRSVLGAGMRVGGAVEELDARPLDPEASTASMFDSHAHRFTVLIPRPLGAEEDAAVRRILDTERPAHTVYDLCTVDAGMRAGNGLHLGVSSIVGPTGSFERAVAGRTLLGRRSVLGPPVGGIAVEAARVARSTRVG